MTPQEFLDSMKTIEYGWLDHDGLRYVNKIAKDKFITDYFLQSPKELEQNKLGVCNDQVEYERKFFEDNKIPHKCIYMLYDDGLKMPMHTFLIFKDNKKYCWFENTYQDVKDSIQTYPTLKALFKHVTEEFIQENKLQIINEEKLSFYMFDTPKYGLGIYDYVDHCRKGTKVRKDYKNVTF